jgi:Zn ribbon nucleic-acid-binding protein
MQAAKSKTVKYEINKFSGRCPQCQIAKNNIEMRQNNIPFWECPKSMNYKLLLKRNAE